MIILAWRIRKSSSGISVCGSEAGTVICIRLANRRLRCWIFSGTRWNGSAFRCIQDVRLQRSEVKGKARGSLLQWRRRGTRRRAMMRSSLPVAVKPRKRPVQTVRDSYWRSAWDIRLFLWCLRSLRCAARKAFSSRWQECAARRV